MTQRISIDPRFEAALAQLGLVNFDSFMQYTGGDLIDRAKDRHIRRITLGDTQGYLKCIGPDRLRKHVQSLFRGAPPRSAALREVAMLRHLHAADIPAATPIAWGQRLVLGVPRESFLLTQAVPGVGLHDRLLKATGDDRVSLIRRFGLLLGRLHSRGFFHIVRPKDIIVQPDGQFVLIDREVAAPWPRRFSINRCCHGMARVQAKLLRNGPPMDDRDWATLFTAYLVSIDPLHNASPEKMRPLIVTFLKRIQRDHRYRDRKI